MSEFGLNVKDDTGGKRIEIWCKHQSGILYVVPGEASWVCSESSVHAHAIAGFLKELVDLDDNRVFELMQRWGLYYRTRSLTVD